MLRENRCIAMATNFYSSSAISSVYANPDTICNTPLPPITTVTEKLYFPIVKNGDKPSGNQSIVGALDGSVLSDLDFNSHGGNLAEKICSGDQSTEKVYGEAGNLAELDNSFLLYQNTDKFNFQNINSEFQPSGTDFYMNSYGEEHQVHQLPHLLPQMELIPSSVTHNHQSCVQQSWSSRIQQQLIQGEEEAENVDDSEQLQQQIMLQQQALQLNQLFSQQLEQQNQQTHAVQENLQQFQLLNTSHQQQQQQQHIQQQSQQLPQQTQHLQQLYHDQGLMYDSSLPSNEGMVLPSIENGNILSNEVYCADALANFLLKTEFQTSACLSGSVSSTTQSSFPIAQQTNRSTQQCCSTTTLDLLEAIRLENKGLKFNASKTDSSVEGDHMSPNHDLPSSTTDGCSGSSVGGKTGSGESHGGSKIRVADKEELNTKEIASRVRQVEDVRTSMKYFVRLGHYRGSYLSRQFSINEVGISLNSLMLLLI